MMTNCFYDYASFDHSGVKTMNIFVITDMCTITFLSMTMCTLISNPIKFHFYNFSVSKRWKLLMQDPVLWRTLHIRSFNCYSTVNVKLKNFCEHLSVRLSRFHHLRPITMVRLTLEGGHVMNSICKVIFDNCLHVTTMIYDIPTCLSASQIDFPHREGRYVAKCTPSTNKLILNGEPKQLMMRSYKRNLLLQLHASSGTQTNHATIQYLDLCGICLNTNSLSIILPNSLVNLHLRWPFFNSTADLARFLSHTVATFVNLESLIVSWPHCTHTDFYDDPSLDDLINSLSTTEKLNRLTLRGFKQSLSRESFRKFTIEAKDMQVLQLDDCDFIDDIAVQSIGTNMTQLTNLSISVMNNKPRVTDLGFQALMSCQNLQILDISGQAQVSAGALVDVVSSLPNLNQIILRRSLIADDLIRKYMRSRRDISFGFR